MNDYSDIEKSPKGRYLVFAWSGAARGGMKDCIGGYDDMKDATLALREMDTLPVHLHVYDTEGRRFVRLSAAAEIDDGNED